jgi:hypothetical protein
MKQMSEVVYVSPFGRALYIRTVGETWGGGRFLWMSGQSALLADAVCKAEAPIGILCDRLDEVPEECAAPVEVVRAATEWLRRREGLI